jgi:lipopolysaccharide transport system ATP-binding protein
MTDIVIKVENLGKKYVIGHQAERGDYTLLRDVLMQNARTLWEIGGHDAASCPPISQGKPIIQGDTMEEVWALQDVSFEIRRGEAVRLCTIIHSDINNCAC